MIDGFNILRNIGQFDSVTPGATVTLTPLSMIYAENGRGKTTIAAILRSLSIGDPSLIMERQRLGSQHPPHVVGLTGPKLHIWPVESTKVEQM